MADSSTASPACILLVYGIPGSGKTTLSRALLEHYKGEEKGASGLKEASQIKGDGNISKWNFFAVHFDEFYPPDLREQKAEDVDTSQFHLKQARWRVHSCLEHFIIVNCLGSTANHSKYCGDADTLLSGEVSEPPTPTTQDWDVFVTSLRKHCSEPRTLDAKGRIIDAEGRATILVLDDNMPLRSMRYEYYQLARKYLLGYAEVYLQCSPSVALDRNSKRPIPIPHSTIESMEQRMELPEPTQHHWEKRSLVVRSDCQQEQFIPTAVANICSIVENALRYPVQPLPEVDTALKETCKLVNISSYVHQADNTLRRCISQLMQKPSDGSGDPMAKDAKASLARKANTVRKQLLEELRTGHLCGKPLAMAAGEHSANSEEFKRIISDAFTTMLKE